MAIFCFFGRTRKFVRKGGPKRYLYFWGIWSPFTVRIFLWHYEKRTLNALGFWQKITRRLTGGVLFFAFSHEKVGKAESCEREKFVKYVGKAEAESDDIVISKVVFSKFFYYISRYFFCACFFGIVLIFYKVVDFFYVLEIPAVFCRNDGAIV